ncbi:MAG: hypothetical protein AAF616_12750 [Bacteroidota bacterium]
MTPTEEQKGSSSKKPGITLLSNVPAEVNYHDLNPEGSLVIGSVLKILEKQQDETICALHFCTASVLIEEVLQRGRSYQGFLRGGDTLKVNFTLTLEPTLKVFPDQQNMENLPGLNVSDRFRAEVVSSLPLGSNRRYKEHSIRFYEKIH